MRLYKVTRRQAEAIVAGPNVAGTDRLGNPVLVGNVEDGREVAIVVALDDPDLVITLMDRSTP
jgi:hypothetical protein